MATLDHPHYSHQDAQREFSHRKSALKATGSLGDEHCVVKRKRAHRKETLGKLATPLLQHCHNKTYCFAYAVDCTSCTCIITCSQHSCTQMQSSDARFKTTQITVRTHFSPNQLLCTEMRSPQAAVSRRFGVKHIYHKNCTRCW